MYKSYCYESLYKIKDIIKSELFLQDGTRVEDVVVQSGHITIYDPNYNMSMFYPPTCSQLGFSSSYTGITTPDAVLLGSSISLVLVIAWGIKILRRAL